MSEKVENELFQSVISGDDKKFELWLLQIYDQLYAFVDQKLPSWLRETVDADDIVQEAHISGFRKLKQFNGQTEQELVAWMRAIAENKLRDAIRTTTRQKRGGGNRKVRIQNDAKSSSIQELVVLLSDGGLSPSGRFAAKEAQRAITVGIATLPDDQRTAINLRYIEGKSIQETAHLMQKSPDAVKGLLHRGKLQLRDSLDRSSRWFSN